MRRLYIVVEGQTEQCFVNEMLARYLFEKGIYSVTPILIRTSMIGRGGLVNFEHLKNTINGLLKSSQNDFVVSTFVDYFRLPNNMPGYDKAVQVTGDLKKVEILQNELGEAFKCGHFIPYIQLHEFEALLFSNNKGFEYIWDKAQAGKTKEIVDEYSNPEDINSSPETAPSKRLLSINKRYDKVLEGNLIALEVGINAMLDKCPRFSDWVNRLVIACSN